MKLAIVVCLAAYVAADATADADADPALLYSSYGVHPYTYGVGSLAYAPRYYANSGGAVHIVKREAEAEPAADADADAALYSYHYGGYHPYSYSAYRHPYANWGYRYPFYRHFGKRSADAEPVADATAEPTADADADAALYGYHYGGYHPYSYSAYRHPFAYSGYRYPFYHHYGKRSAEAEPHRGYYGYGGYYGYSRPHYGYGYYRG